MPVQRKFLLKPSDTLGVAMQRVGANKEGFAAVVDDDKKLLGTFCDADGRYAMLRGVDLETPVSAVMAKGRARLARLPGSVVVTGGVVSDIVRAPRPPIDGVVMAGGRGTRLRATTGSVPKPLLNLGRSSILERILGRMAKAGVSDAWLAVSYKADMFKKRIGSGKQLGLSVDYLRESMPLGTAGALSMLPAKGADYVFVTNADLITSVDYARMFDFHRAHGGPITMAAASFVTNVKYGVVHPTKAGLLDRMEEKPALEFLANAGMYVISRDVLKLIPRDTFFQMPELLDAVQAKGGAVHVFPMFEKWVDAGSPEEFQQVLIEFATGVES